ncbi:MAG: hypothetical protein GY737_10285 [Desulfobacteraceae bacterium]|nr:hypothetical protein [Desulfobacteraceae bacterium]
MAISINNKCLKKEEFKDEYELQGYLERSPYLLVSESEPIVSSVQREINLPSAGILDLLLVDESGCPIAVEVKLSRNSQSRREVVAQAFDYVSDLSQVTVDELDAKVGGALDQVLKDLNPNISLWKTCGTNLRAGIIKVIIAVDEANDDLIRIIRYINDHSDLDVRLVAIRKFKNGEILVPSIIVAGNKSQVVSSHSGGSVEMNPFFEEVVNIYNNSATDELKTRNRAKGYRQIYFTAWPWSVHYEFTDYKSSNQVGVELHLETDEVAHLGQIIKKYAGQTISQSVIEWDKKWSKQRGRLSTFFSVESDAELIARSMSELITLTSKDVNDKLTVP